MRLINTFEPPQRQIWKQTDHLPSGENVLIDLGAQMPLDTGDRLWFRKDLNYYVVGTPKAVAALRVYLERLGGQPDV